MEVTALGWVETCLQFGDWALHCSMVLGCQSFLAPGHVSSIPDVIPMKGPPRRGASFVESNQSNHCPLMFPHPINKYSP